MPIHRRIPEDELLEVIQKHEMWLKGESGGVQADLSGENLYAENLSNANLANAKFTNSVLSHANLTSANLNGADMCGAELNYTKLIGADLTEARLNLSNLRGADLTGAKLVGANLRFTSLVRATLTGANLTDAKCVNADLSYADLTRADLTGVNLFGAVLSDAILEGAILPDFQLVPKEGPFIGWKKVRGGAILKLLIPEDARRTSSLIGRKCRASKVVVLEGEGTSLYSASLKYSVGQTVFPDAYSDDIRVECANGIHFFSTKKEAEKYKY